MSAMAKRQARRRLLPAALSLGLLVSAVLTVALGAPAGADVVPPPSGSLPAGQWIAFAISPTNPVSGQQVTLSVAGSSGVGPADLWGPGGWPGSWNADGITLDQPTPCPDTASSCSYTIGGSSSGPFVFGINLANNLTPQQIQNLQQSIGVQQPPTTTTTTSPPVTAPPGPDPTFTGPPNGQLTGPGQFTFQAKGETGVAYQWTLSANGATVDSKNDPPGTPATYSPPSSIFSQPGTYTLTLTATAGGGIASKQDSVQ